jgi:hypothetical protein
MSSPLTYLQKLARNAGLPIGLCSWGVEWYADLELDGDAVGVRVSWGLDPNLPECWVADFDTERPRQMVMSDPFDHPADAFAWLAGQVRDYQRKPCEYCDDEGTVEVWIAVDDTKRVPCGCARGCALVAQEDTHKAMLAGLEKHAYNLRREAYLDRR